MATIVVREGTVLPERIAHDHYATPAEFVEKGLRVVERTVRDRRVIEGGLRPPCFVARDPLGWEPRILDPGAGEGIWGQGARFIWAPKEVVGVELRDVPRPESYDRWHLGDFLTLPDELLAIGAGYDLVLGNPPYKYAEAFCRRSLELSRHGGIVCFLFYLTFLESRRRGNGLFAAFPPFTVSVAKERPAFTGKSNPNAACFVTWVKGYAGPTQMEWV